MRIPISREQLEGHNFDWSYPLAFFWGILVLASLIGWGRIVSWCLLSPQERDRIGWGLAAAWGMAAFLVISGPMLLFSIFSKQYTLFFLIAGCLALVRWFFLYWKRSKIWSLPPTFSLKVALVVLSGLLVLHYAEAVAAREYNQYDDFAAYFYLTKKVLDTGTFFDPFSYRMLGALGGQLTLGTFILGFLPWKYANIMDMGIAWLIACGLTQQFIFGYNRKGWIVRICLFALTLTFPIPHTNTASEWTGVVLFMALFYSFDLVANRKIRGWRSAILLSSVAIGAATLRCHNVFMIGLLGAGFVGWRFWKRTEDYRQLVRESLQQLAVTLVFITPWLIVTYRSGGTILFPIFKGNFSPHFEIFNAHLSTLDTIKFIFGFFESTPYCLLFMPLCFIWPGSQRLLICIQGGIIFILSLTFISQITTGTIMYSSIYRYLAPIGFAFSLYVCGTAALQFLESGIRPQNLKLKCVRFCVVFLVLMLGVKFLIISVIDTSSIGWAVDPKNEMWCEFVGGIHTKDASKEYSQALARIPRGSKIFVAVDYPFLIDTQAFPTFSSDVVGAASPPPGFPYFEGVAPVRKYLLEQGISYIVNVPFERSRLLQSRETSRQEMSLPGQFFQIVGRYKWDFFNNIDALAASNKVIYSGSTIRVISLNN